MCKPLLWQRRSKQMVLPLFWTLLPSPPLRSVTLSRPLAIGQCDKFVGQSYSKFNSTWFAPPWLHPLIGAILLEWIKIEKMFVFFLHAGVTELIATFPGSCVFPDVHMCSLRVLCSHSNTSYVISQGPLLPGSYVSQGSIYPRDLSSLHLHGT